MMTGKGENKQEKNAMMMNTKMQLNHDEIWKEEEKKTKYWHMNMEQ